MTKTYEEWLLEKEERLDEDVGASLVLLTTILVGLPVGTAVAKTITSIIDTISTLRNDRKTAEANSLAKKAVEKYKHLGKDKLEEEEGANCNVVANVEASGPYTNRSGKKEKRKSLEEVVDETFKSTQILSEDINEETLDESKVNHQDHPEVHAHYQALKQRTTAQIHKEHQSIQGRVHSKYSAAEMGGKRGMISDILHNKHGKKKVDGYFNHTS